MFDWFFRQINKLGLYKFHDYIQPFDSKIALDWRDLLMMIILAMCGYYARLYNVQYPSNIIFDECHFGNFTNGYITRNFFYDIHPPFAKLQFALFDWLQEYDGSIVFGGGEDRSYRNENYITLRMTCVMYSSLVPCTIYLAMRTALLSRVAAFTSGFLISVETSMIGEGKYIYTDGTLHFYTMFSMIIINLFLTKEPRAKEWYIWMRIASIFISFAFSIKNTALSLLILIMYTQAVEIVEFRTYKLDIKIIPEVIHRGWNIFWPSLAVHYAIWIIHFQVIPYGTSDTRDYEWLLYGLVDRKRGNETNMMRWVRRPPLLNRIFSSIATAYISNGINFEPHHCMTRPQDWPLLRDKWIVYYSGWGEPSLYCCGNYFVYIMTFCGVVLSMLCFWSKKKFPLAMRFIVGYWASYLPFYGVPRTMFLYHYHIPLMFAACCVGCSLDLLFEKRRFWKGFFSICIIFTAFVGYMILNPFVYGRKHANRDWRLLNRNWRDGKPGRDKFEKLMRLKAEAIRADDEDMKNQASAQKSTNTTNSLMKKKKWFQRQRKKND
ncbi:Dolichyl-phosphate-mannose-protein mannosyltransferase, putative [Trichomonas vaginalis G3]|uniref:Dolichyl-phosphate-mannose-protein mannosyltransferase, putative n=1 Tax=Trichomonas vaginalis (strain ATCC PRA-98 / G3) TaxID=412133 RepID=A2ESJ3_TRIV3|nr:dolichyl-phosphate-mannose-protein mannosyltransferase protein [Trichomonas vaginalis G3]EAY04373.1 Dolichyl-phosphate-mannose-protein mannosyltransferase, putative [Trichomonas vaginalis G3]KAI5540307.1 dolichyl-phosphate-mannose-protein mannosyltransferase protein [Trichomonas vaginalis G3]|eukprot:XP_001316596.1 Dolichyl-phosphate-mannose-protein mannosyltransferase [Trichomonas vaginalis G3]